MSQQWGPPAYPPQGHNPPAYSGRRFVYMVVSLVWDTLTDQALNHYGVHGWELVNVVQGPGEGRTVRCVFKRDA